MHFRSHKVVLLALSTIVIMVGIYTTINYLHPTTDDNSNAMTYSNNADVSFTFAPTLSIGLSANNLTIDNLVPGTTSTSNTVTVTVSSNTPYGYVLSAGVGSTEPTDPYYNTSDLVHDNTTTEVPTANKFTSIPTSASLSSLTTDNTWGYSTSTNGGTSWSTYSGHSHKVTKPLLDISAAAQPSTIDFKIAARSATTQASGTYNNVITFYAVGKPEPHYLYEEVAKMSKGTQTAGDLQAEITKDNSGVYEYNNGLFGASSDASNANKIYYYRGIIDDSFADSSFDGYNIGSSGDGILYPNYVILTTNGTKSNSDTCWRITRTTGSGGIKMLYNGKWTGTTCANVFSGSSIGDATFNDVASYETAKVLSGYTYDSNYAVDRSWMEATISDLFGTNNSNSNTTNSTIKSFVEQWYDENLLIYTKKLEPGAGYCTDRSMLEFDSEELLSESTLVKVTTGHNLFYIFGAYPRNYTSTSPPTLRCAQFSKNNVSVNRSKVDLYTTEGTSHGNGQLSRPLALLTADEATFAGAKGYHDSIIENKSIFISANRNFWLLSPAGSLNSATVFIIDKDRMFAGGVGSPRPVRPVISLVPGTQYISGSGTAADPWVVTAL